jgi:hypothetical protein
MFKQVALSNNAVLRLVRADLRPRFLAKAVFKMAKKHLVFHQILSGTTAWMR